MQFMLLVYVDPDLAAALPTGEADEMMRACLQHADELRRDGTLLDSQMLADAGAARAVRVRRERVTVLDGPYAEAKEVLGGFNLIEAQDMEEAVRIAADFPWTRIGCVEVRPVQSIAEVRRRVGSPAAEAVHAPATA